MGKGYSEISAFWGINRRSAMFREEASASLVLNMLGFIFICVLTQSAPMPFLFFGSQSVTSVSSTVGFAWLQSHKPVVTTIDCDLLCLCFMVVLTAVCVSWELWYYSVSTLPKCILFCNQKGQFAHKIATCIYCKLSESTFKLLQNCFHNWNESV